MAALTLVKIGSFLIVENMADDVSRILCVADPLTLQYANGSIHEVICGVSE